MKCLYHANCNDGSGAALAVWLKYGDIGHEYIPCQYGNPLPDGLENSDIIMVDFSAKKEQIRELARIADSILIIDHHITAKADLDDVDDGFGCRIETIFNMDQSGAVLAWTYFHPLADIPKLFLYIQDRDLWKFEVPGSKEVHAALQLYPDWRHWRELNDGDLITEGAAIKRYLHQQAEGIVKTPPQMWDITGDVVPVYNLQGFMISDTLHLSLETYPECQYAVAYFDLPDKRVYSLRSRSGSDIDVSEIAKQHGGGGHKHSAGFTV